MRFTLTTILLCFILTSCQKDEGLSLQKSNEHKIIAIQPLGSYDKQQLQQIQYQLGEYFHTRVIILDVVDLPQSFKSNSDDRYSADAIIEFLLQLKNDSVVQVVGLTHKEIYTIRDEDINGIKGINLEHSIRGLGYISNNACIVSDYSFKSENELLSDRKVWKAVLHEIGHNIGLPHCEDEDCTMSEKNGNIGSLKMFGNDFCEKCRKKAK